ncbi:RNA 2',3'-cyclic phosphodiesterase [Paenibacillus sp. FSL M8-0334]|uniref:RNA 2',3'-cyclic phosphodiesterase n=2 Tax=Paenibacillus campinasensis TaxID=66347 RepID=A0A268EY36_9BACL|nr:RNA 2',3'-cyclic phosphodiesterase [Paenibacillus campinasensis]MUG66565.1 RNA 2',3'-cyclic phosphodiesterase [Paenibacillus campinasensis]PAD78029.1 RNA 2',3'-cyclic phosphodiesterase [Paenibacillus campinasensis]
MSGFGESMERLFIAVHLPEEASANIREWAEKLSGQASFRKWVHPADYHVTVQFLGDTPAGRIPEIVQALQTAASAHAPFMLGVSNAGVFGTNASPRILWAGLNGDIKALSALHRSVVSSMEAFGYVPESRPYRPHITVARKFEGKFPFMMDLLGSGPNPIQWKVDELTLFRTRLGHSPMYEKLDVARLHGHSK